MCSCLVCVDGRGEAEKARGIKRVASAESIARRLIKKLNVCADNFATSTARLDQ
jgi:hypothetical protein